MMGKYITIVNKVSKRSVPFIYNEFGEIIINSIRPEDTDDNCFVKSGDVYFEYSQDMIYTQRIIN
jgi:hypothetical protein